MGLSFATVVDPQNGGMPLLNRLLWARLDSLPRSLFNKMMVRLTAERFLLQVDAQKMKRISKLNALRTSPIDLNNRIRTIASMTVHNAFHHEARSYAQEIGDTILQTFLIGRLDELSRIMQSNIVE